MKSGSINLSKLSSKDLVGRFEGDGVCATRTTKVEKQDMVGESVKYPFGVLIVLAPEIMQEGDIHLLLCDLVTRAQMKCHACMHGFIHDNTLQHANHAFRVNVCF